MVLDPQKPFPKRPRLKDFDYTGTYAYFITILTKDGTIYFKKAEIVDEIINILAESANQKKI